MKSKLIIHLFLLLSTSLFAKGLNLASNKNGLKITGSFEIQNFIPRKIAGVEYTQLKISGCGNGGKIGEPETPVYSKLVSLPEIGNYVLKTLNYNFDEITLDKKIVPVGWEDNKHPKNDYYSKNDWFPKKIVKVGRPNIMRGYRFSQISIVAVQYNPAQNKLKILKDIDAEFEYDYSKNENPMIKDSPAFSQSFSSIAKANIYGIEEPKSIENGIYLFIAPDNDLILNSLQPLLRWKEKLGYKTKLATLSETGSTNTEIRDYLQNAYNNWEIPPEYVVLVGDVTGNFVIPAFYVEGGQFSPWDVTDHSYTLLDGDDYFPDIMIGRISVQNQTQLMTVVNKIIKYESAYYSGDWIKRALMISFIYDDSWWHMYSHRETKMAVREKLLDFGYAQVDTFIYPYQTGQTQLANMINEGYSFVNFRGCGSYDYWSSWWGYIFFDIDNINDLTNSFMLPMITSITCAGGAFDNENFPSCFGETWLIAGSPSTPKGAIGFIGPSELDTQTGWNNCNDIGIYQGITQENLYRCGEMLLRGKMELYINYPYCHDWGGPEDSDQFYFYVYNLLGDPGLAVWTDIPKEIDLSFNKEILQGENYLQVEIITDETDISDFTIAITNDDSLITTGITNENGTANIPVNLPIGNYLLTASKYGFIPKTDTLTVMDGNIISLYDYSFTNDIISGQSVNLNATLKNIGNTSAENVQIKLISNDDYIQIISDSAFADSIPADDTLCCNFQFQVRDEWKNGCQTELFLNVNSNFGNDNFLIPIEIASPELVLSEFIVNNVDSCLIQNQTAEVYIALKNCGNYNSGDFNANLVSLNDKTNVVSHNSYYTNIMVDSIGISVNPFQIEVADVISGELAQFRLEISDDDILLQNLIFTIPIGTTGEYSPTFCEYGYYAIESNDIGNFTSPAYNWIEIDPQYGGNGNLIGADHTTSNGYIKILDLPFQFQYFGRYYYKVSVCSNGCLSMGETELIFHRNRTIPSGVGPKAMIAPFWDDLQDGNMYYYYDADNHYFVIEWSEWKNVYNPFIGNETFEVVLYDPEYHSTPTGDGEILFQYKEIHNVDQDENYATVGIENETQTQGLLMTFANIYSPTAQELQNETAILFTIKDAFTPPCLSVSPISISVSIPSDTFITKNIILTNNGEVGSDLTYTISISHFTKNTGKLGAGVGKSIENDTLICITNAYIPIMPMDILFYLYHSSPDNEPVYGAKINFPSGFFVNSATDIGTLGYNNETGDGVEISWGFGNGAVLSATGFHPFNVNVTIDSSHTEPVELEWYIEGDGTGAEPHTKSGTINLLPTGDSYLWLTYPNGGEKMVVGLQDSVKWLHYGDVEQINIELSLDNGSNWESLASGVDNSGFYEFIVPCLLSDNCKMRISSLDGNVSDISNNVFQITALNIVYPSYGITMVYNTQDSIKWVDCGGIDTVKIELSTDGSNWVILSDKVENTGYYEFTVPGPTSDRCKIKISTLDEAVYNMSESFSIVDSPVNWIIPSVTTGSIAGGQSDDIALLISSEGLSIGIYDAFVKITTNFGQIVNIPIQLEVTSVGVDTDQYLKTLKLYQNYPNPFSTYGKNPTTQIQYSIPKDSKVELKIYNIKGELVKTIVNERKSIGYHKVIWEGKNNNNRAVCSGIYFYRLKVDDKVIDTKKCLLLK